METMDPTRLEKEATDMNTGNEDGKQGESYQGIQWNVEEHGAGKDKKRHVRRCFKDDLKAQGINMRIAVDTIKDRTKWRKLVQTSQLTHT